MLRLGSRPNNLGVHDGRLAPPSSRPNNVHSQVDAAADPVHAIAPIAFTDGPVQAFRRLGALVREWPRVTIVVERADYLHAETASKMLGFVDDNEFYLDRKARVIHVRAAARLGFSDLGANRARIEALRKRFVSGR